MAEKRDSNAAQKLDRREQTWRKAISLLEKNEAKQAMELVSPHAKENHQLTNLYGVCLMRAGNPQAAVQVYRSLVLAGNGLDLRSDVPTVYVANYATALFLADNIPGGYQVLTQLARREKHPAAAKLQDAMDRWFRGLSFWQRLNYRLGGQPSIPVTFDFPPGFLEEDSDRQSNGSANA